TKKGSWHVLTRASDVINYACRLHNLAYSGARMPRTIVLAYSGGLDTSIIVPWLKENYPGCRVICVAGNIGQGSDELSGVRAKALASRADRSRSRARSAPTLWRMAAPARATIKYASS